MTERDFGHYVAGYVDGEGCFCISFNPRQKLATGWEVRPSFSVSQNGDRAEVLYRIQAMFQCGTIRRDPANQTLKYETRSLQMIVEHVIPFFQRFPLLSAKYNDFLAFKAVCELMVLDAHRSSDGLVRIQQLVSTMNPSGSRKYVINPEDIVSATGNSGKARNSDPHEWRNGLVTVSKRDSVKLHSR